MRKGRLQNKVSGSMFTLPVAAVIAALLWWMPAGHYELSTGIGIALAAIVAYVLLETNNKNMLIRVRSRMVSSCWVFFAAVIASMHPFSFGLLSSLFLSISYYLLFKTYQQQDPVRYSFHAALMLGVSACLVPHVIAFVVLFIWHQMVFLRSMTFRALFAILIGSLFPFLLWGGYCLFVDDYSMLLDWVGRLISYDRIQPSNYTALTIQAIASWLLPSLLILIGCVHYLFTSYNDKIQVRMMLYIYVVQFLAIEIFVGLQPAHCVTWLPLLLVSGVPLLAHFYALTSSWFTNFLFVLSALLLAGLAYLNLWMPLQSF